MESQVLDEVKGCSDFLEFASGVLRLHLPVGALYGRQSPPSSFWTEGLHASTFSSYKRPEKYLGDIETWDRAEKALADALNACCKPWQVRDSINAAGYFCEADVTDRKLQKKTFPTNESVL